MIRRIAATFVFMLASSPAVAAQVTHVATAATDEWPVEFDLYPGFNFTSESANIGREQFKPGGGLIVGTEMAYNRTTMSMPLRAAIGLYHHLEVHFNIPIIIDDRQTWGYSSVANESNITVDKTPTLCPEGIPTNGICANGQAPAALAPSPLVGANGQGLTSDRGGWVLGNVSVGLAWTPFNEEDDDTDPTWLVAFDYQAPTATLWDPSIVSYGPGSPSGQIGGVGDRFHHFQPYSALSKRYGVFDPYIEVYADLPRASGGVYDNCENPYGGAGEGPGNAGGQARTNCNQSGTYIDPTTGASAAYNWNAWATQATPVYIGGFWFGSEFVAYENPKENQKVAFDARFVTEYHSQAETYTQVTDLVRALTYQQDFARLGGEIGAYLRPTKYFMLLLNGTLLHDTDHWLSIQDLGVAPQKNGVAEPVPVGSAAQNPLFDFRFDNPGDRFLLQNSLIWSFNASVLVSF